MADISMCSRSDCPKCNTCFRFRATPNKYYQSYIIIDDIENCQMYWHIDNLEDFEKLKANWRD